ncbi:MAG: hypothetical protein AAF787_19580, partial [Chloroflexota bacterium]
MRDMTDPQLAEWYTSPPFKNRLNPLYGLLLCVMLAACSPGTGIDETPEPFLTGSNEVVYALASQPASFDHHVTES